ncbi:MAG: hypothetical protein ABII82_14455 [Verrucomicrobiota bacterium]
MPFPAFSRIAVFLVLAPVAFLSALRAEPRTFTDQEGRTIVAEIVSATDRTVKIRRDDGRVFEVPVMTFVLEDRKYIEAWLKEQSVQAAPLRLRVEVSQSKKTVGRSEGISSNTRMLEAGYRILIKNESAGPLDNLKIDYRVFKFDDRVGLDDRKRSLQKISGTIGKVSVPRFGQNEFTTKGINLTVHQLKPNWSYIGGADPRTADSLAGIWLRLIDGSGEVIHEYASSDKLMEEGW